MTTPEHNHYISVPSRFSIRAVGQARGNQLRYALLLQMKAAPTQTPKSIVGHQPARGNLPSTLRALCQTSLWVSNQEAQPRGLLETSRDFRFLLRGYAGSYAESAKARGKIVSLEGVIDSMVESEDVCYFRFVSRCKCIVKKAHLQENACV